MINDSFAIDRFIHSTWLLHLSQRLFLLPTVTPWSLSEIEAQLIALVQNGLNNIHTVEA